MGGETVVTVADSEADGRERRGGSRLNIRTARHPYDAENVRIALASL
jgi:hypothetical protein